MNTQTQSGITLVFNGLTPATAAALLATHSPTTPAVTKGGRKKPERTTENTDEIDVSEMARGKDGKKRKPKAKFASNAAEESEEEETEEESEEEETEESEESEEEEEFEESEEEEESEEDDEEPVSFAQVKKAIDKYGEKKPKAMKTLLSSFNLKSTVELKKATKKWAPVLRKINATFGK